MLQSCERCGRLIDPSRGGLCEFCVSASAIDVGSVGPALVHMWHRDAKVVEEVLSEDPLPFEETMEAWLNLALERLDKGRGEPITYDEIEAFMGGGG